MRDRKHGLKFDFAFDEECSVISRKEHQKQMMIVREISKLDREIEVNVIAFYVTLVSTTFLIGFGISALFLLWLNNRLSEFSDEESAALAGTFVAGVSSGFVGLRLYSNHLLKPLREERRQLAAQLSDEDEGSENKISRPFYK